MNQSRRVKVSLGDFVRVARACSFQGEEDGAFWIMRKLQQMYLHLHTDTKVDGTRGSKRISFKKNSIKFAYYERHVTGLVVEIVYRS